MPKSQKGFAPALIIIIISLILGSLFLLLRPKQLNLLTNNQPQLQKPTEKTFDIPQDIPINISGKILYSKIGCEVKSDSICLVTYPQLLDLDKDQKASSDKFNNANFIKPFFGDRVAMAWSPDGSKFVTQGNIDPGLPDYKPDREHNDSKYEGKLYLYDINKMYDALNNTKSYDPILLNTIKSLNFRIDQITWSPDGKKLAYWTSREVRSYDTATNITVNELINFDIETKESNILISENVDRPGKYDESFKPLWSPDSSKILISKNASSKTDTFIREAAYIDINTLEQTVILKGSQAYDWVNDKEVIMSDDNGVFSYDFITQTKRPIINGITNNIPLSKDKKSVVFYYHGDNGKNSGIEVLALNNGFTFPKAENYYLQFDTETKFLKNRPNFAIFPEGLDLAYLNRSDSIVWSPDSHFLVVALNKQSNYPPISYWIFDITNKKFSKVPQLENTYNLSWGL